MKAIVVDEDGIWHRPVYPKFRQALAEPKPVLISSFENQTTIESIPAVKENQKIRFSENVDVMCIENRFQLMDPADYEDDDSYEIEIVEGNGSTGGDDADFYLEMIDGEIFYVFETEDDISVESNDDSSSYDKDAGAACEPLQLDIGGLMTSPKKVSEVQMGESFSHIDYDPSETSASASEGAMHDENGDVRIEDIIQFELPSLPSLPMPRNEPNPPISSPTPCPGDDSLSPKSQSPSRRADVAPSSPRRLPSIDDLDSDFPLSPSRSPPPKSILKACPVSPLPCVGKASSSKEKREKKAKKEKTFTKTFVRASDFDGEHRVYSWEKPTWANQQLKSTGKGDDIRSGANLANPITNAAKLIEKGQVKWEKPEWALTNADGSENDDLNAKAELIRQIQDGTMNLPNLGRSKSRLKLSINGSILATGGDIVKPITKATIIKKPSINFVANPKILRATPGGSLVWSGENLEAPVTQATTIKKYSWETPSWVSKKLQTTNSSELLTRGGGVDVASPQPIAEKRIEWEKPDWTKKRSIVRRADSAQFDDGQKKEYGWQKPSWTQAKLRPATSGISFADGRRDRFELAKPITKLPELVNQPELAKEKPGIVRRVKSFD